MTPNRLPRLSWACGWCGANHSPVPETLNLNGELFVVYRCAGCGRYVDPTELRTTFVLPALAVADLN